MDQTKKQETLTKIKDTYLKEVDNNAKKHIAHTGNDLASSAFRPAYHTEMTTISNPPKVRHSTDKKGEDGRVIIDKKNFLTTKIKKGATDNVLFTKPDYTTIGIHATQATLTKILASSR